MRWNTFVTKSFLCLCSKPTAFLLFIKISNKWIDEKSTSNMLSISAIKGYCSRLIRESIWIMVESCANAINYGPGMG